MKIHKEGRTIIFVSYAICFLFSGVLFYLYGFASFGSWAWFTLSFLFAAFNTIFFRDPVRNAVGTDRLVGAPADGKVVIVKEVTENEYLKGPAIQVSIFMSPMNVHVNWYPIKGIVEYFRYHPGKYLVAWHPKSSEKNERTTIVIRNEQNDRIVMRQIAGFVARRIVCYANYEQAVTPNDEAGFIKFGSRADLFLPIDSKILVKPGDRVVGAESVIAEIPIHSTSL